MKKALLVSQGFLLLEAVITIVVTSIVVGIILTLHHHLFLGHTTVIKLLKIDTETQQKRERAFI